MRSIFLASSIAALTLTAATTRADDVEYPDQNVVFATRLDPTPIVTSDVTYEGPHAVLTKDSPGPGRGAMAAYDDVRYQTDDSRPAKSSPSRDSRQDCRVAQQDFSCPHHG
jgi:hypothetical protein